MENLFVVAIVIVGLVAVLAAIILYFVAKKFKVETDERIDLVLDALPGANCGGCGFPGCSNFAEACVKDGLEGKFCSAGGNDVMQNVASILGLEATAQDPKVAVFRCQGSIACRPKVNIWEGADSCAILSSTYTGQTGCSFGCLGLGDCVKACEFSAIALNPQTGLIEINEKLCTGCGSCSRACPKGVIEIRKRFKGDKKVFVSCVNKDKGGVARKACSAACIGCGKCAKTCPFGAITVENNVAHIDFNICKLCRKCVEACPTHAIVEENFPMRKQPEMQKVVSSVASQNQDQQ